MTVFQPYSAAYSSPCALITQPRSPGLPSSRIISRPPTETVVSVRHTNPVAEGRRKELLESAYAYVRDHGIAELSLRPLAAAIGSSPRVLLFLFESKDGLIRALLARAREDELARLAPEATLAATAEAL